MNGQRAQPMDPRRAIDALSNAVTAELLRAERPGVRVGVALVAGIVVIIGLLARVVPSLEWLGRLPFPVPLIAVLVTATVVVAAMPLAMLPRRTVDGWVALTFLALEGQAEWRGRTGEDYPATPEAAERWLARHPDPAAHRLQRASLLLALGRPREAGEIVAAHDPIDQPSAFLHAQLAWLAAFMGDRDDPELLQRCHSLAEAYPIGGRDRQVADASVELLGACRAFALERDWMGPLVCARRAMGNLPHGLLLRHMLIPRLRHYAVTSAAVGALLVAIHLLVGLEQR